MSTRERPSCLHCFEYGSTGPEYGLWKGELIEAELIEDEDRYYDLFPPGKRHPCAWVHLSCIYGFIHDHAIRTAGSIKCKIICMICEVDVRADELLPLYGSPDSTVEVAWVHAECIADY